MSKIIELKRPSMVLLCLGLIMTLIGITIFLNPQDDTTNIIFLSLFGGGLFISGLSISILNQIRKQKSNHKFIFKSMVF
ncbi:Hypothetical protein Nlim_0560 [Candidatus Nitrosarchaeum limnium SFB1]|uniref:Uncharacterized protein n=1 Tax=Candidatus Nitrosarchaeum limnium SFB1 TaxID=886738 RepID=F3KJA2_9ARCH|nr:Hypothetical protein Nlim_0560 [Candidatus Nitrosarchaeum limnium SFB1]